MRKQNEKTLFSRYIRAKALVRSLNEDECRVTMNTMLEFEHLIDYLRVEFGQDNHPDALWLQALADELRQDLKDFYSADRLCKPSEQDNKA